MALVQKDYILRLIESVSAAIARVVKRKEAGDLTGARREVDIALAELLGTSGRLVPLMDSRTASELVGDSRRVTAWALLLREDADVCRLMLRDAEAVSVERRGLELLLEAWMRDRSLPTEAIAALESLRGRVDPRTLDPRYRDALGTVQKAPT